MEAEGFSYCVLPGHTRALKLFCNIDASGLAAVLFVLVVIMMIVQPSPHHGVGPDLPHVSHAVSVSGANREDAMVVTVLRDGSIYFGTDKVRPDHVRSKILDRLKYSRVERKVYIRADRRVRYSTVKDILEGVRSSGIERVAFLVDQRRPPAAER